MPTNKMQQQEQTGIVVPILALAVAIGGAYYLTKLLWTVMDIRDSLERIEDGEPRRAEQMQRLEEEIEDGDAL